MSNTKSKKGMLLSVVTVIVLVAAFVVGILFGMNGNTAISDTQTVTVSVDRFIYKTPEKLADLEEICEAQFDGLKFEQKKGEMSGNVCEIVYVFAEDADLSKIDTTVLENNLNAKFNANDEGWEFGVSVNTVDVQVSLAKGTILRGAIAVTVFAVLAFAYVAIRYMNWKTGLVAAIAVIAGAGLTLAIVTLVRIPATVSVVYAAAYAALFSAVATVLTFNKKNTEKIVSTIAVFTAIALVLVAVASVIAAGAISAVTWFAVQAIVATAVVAFVGMIYVPALCEMTATEEVVAPVIITKKEKVKAAAKAAPKASKAQKEAPVVEETKEEAPVEETEVELEAEEETVEETEEVAETEEVVEDAAEDTPVEESVEETAEEVVEEVAEETTEAPVEEEPATEEVAVEESATEEKTED